MPTIVLKSLEQAQEELLKMSETITGLEQERDSYKQQSIDKDGEIAVREKTIAELRDYNQKLFNRLPVTDKTGEQQEDEKSELTIEEFAQTLKY